MGLNSDKSSKAFVLIQLKESGWSAWGKVQNAGLCATTGCIMYVNTRVQIIIIIFTNPKQIAGVTYFVVL